MPDNIPDLKPVYPQIHSSSKTDFNEGNFLSISEFIRDWEMKVTN